jgi:hypothetical protein
MNQLAQILASRAPALVAAGSRASYGPLRPLDRGRGDPCPGGRGRPHLGPADHNTRLSDTCSPRPIRISEACVVFSSGSPLSLGESQARTYSESVLAGLWRLTLSRKPRLARRTSARPAGSAGGRVVAGHNVGTFLQRARSGRGCLARASAVDRAVAAQGGFAPLCRGSSPLYQRRRSAPAARGCRCRKATVVRDYLFLRQPQVAKYFNRTL